MQFTPGSDICILPYTIFCYIFYLHFSPDAGLLCLVALVDIDGSRQSAFDVAKI